MSRRMPLPHKPEGNQKHLPVVHAHTPRKLAHALVPASAAAVTLTTASPVCHSRGRLPGRRRGWSGFSPLRAPQGRDRRRQQRVDQPVLHLAVGAEDSDGARDMTPFLGGEQHRAQHLAPERADTISGADDGELFLEYREGEALVFDDGRLKTASFGFLTGEAPNRSLVALRNSH